MSANEAQPISKIFQFCPRCGTQGESGKNPFKCESDRCEFTFYFSPVAAVGAIITNTDNEVLLLTRGREPGLGKFGLPGGFVDPGESIEDALIREVLEETNLRLSSWGYLTSFPNSYDYLGVTFPVSDAFFVGRVESFDSIQVQADEVSSYQFLELSESHLDNMAFASNRKALEKYLST